MLRILLSDDIYTGLGASLMAQRVKNLPAMQDIQDTWVQSLGWEDALEEKNGNPLQYFCLKIPWTEEPGGLQSMVSIRVGNDRVTKQWKMPF